MKSDEKDAKGALKQSHEQFAQNFVANGGKGKQAAEDAGFASGASAEVTASRLLRNAKVQKRIKELEEQSSASTPEVMGTLASHMRGDIADVFDEETMPPVIKTAKANGVSHLIKRVTFEKDGRTVRSLEFHDPQAAARTLGKYKGLEQQPRENDSDVARKMENMRALVDRLYAEAQGAGESISKAEVARRVIARRPEAARYLPDYTLVSQMEM